MTYFKSIDGCKSLAQVTHKSVLQHKLYLAKDSNKNRNRKK